MKKKNIIYIFADQWNKNAIGYKNSQLITPTIDAFAKKSKVFDNAISTYPLCSPHRASLFTGKYPYNVGMWTNCKIGLDENLMLDPGEVTIGDVLKEEGYQTAYIGKWHLDASEMNYKSKPKSGAIHWDAYTPPGARRQGFDFWYSYGAMDNHLDPHYWMDSPEKIRPKKWSPIAETDVAIDYMKNRDEDKPFCMFISWNPPHPPYDQVPKEYADMYKTLSFEGNVPEELQKDENFLQTVREYYGAITGLDQQFKKIIDYLKVSGLEDETYVVLSADHGDMMGAHNRMGKNIWYEESIGIPFMIQGPDIEHGHTDCLFSSIDHMPTLLDLLNMEIPNTVQGKSFKSFISSSEKIIDEGPEAVFLSMIPGMPELIKPYREKGLNNKAFGWRGYRTKTQTYVVDNGCHPEDEPKRWIYDLVEDPLQLNPKTIKAHSDEARGHDAILKTFLQEIDDPFLL